MKFLNFITVFMIRPNPVRKKKKTKQNKTKQTKKTEIIPTPRLLPLAKKI